MQLLCNEIDESSLYSAWLPCSSPFSGLGYGITAEYQKIEVIFEIF